MQQRVLHAVHAFRLLVEDQHGGIAYGAENAVQKTGDAETSAAPAVHQHDAAADADKARDFHPCQRLVEHQRRQRHHDYRAAVVQQRRGGHADGLIACVQEHPAGSHGCAGQQDQRYVFAASGKEKPVAGQKEKRQQTHAAQQRPQQDDLAALQRDMAGHDAVEAEQQQSDEIADKKAAVLIHGDAS